MEERGKSPFSREARREEGEIKKEKEKETKSSNLFSVWNILLAAAVGSLAVVTIVLVAAGVSRIPVFISLFIAVYLLLMGKNTEEVVEETEQGLKKYEGETLGIWAQISVALSLTGTVIKHKFARYLIALILTLFTGVWLLAGFVVALLLLIIVFLTVAYLIAQYFIRNAKVIPAKPPHLGLVTVMKKRTNVVLKEGYALTVPGIIDFIPINVETVNQDFEKIEDVFSKDNILMHLKGVSLLYAPDPARLYHFINIGSQEGVADTLEDIIPDDLRMWAREYIADSLLEVKRKAVHTIITHLTGDSEITPEKLINGIPDAHLLGIKVFRFTIGPVKPSDEYVKDIEKKRREEIQRDYEVYETGTELEQAKLLQQKFREADEDVSLEKCLRLTKDYKIQREGRPVIPGLGDLLSSGISLVEILKLLRGEKK